MTGTERVIEIYISRYFHKEFRQKIEEGDDNIKLPSHTNFIDQTQQTKEQKLQEKSKHKKITE